MKKAATSHLLTLPGVLLSLAFSASASAAFIDLEVSTSGGETKLEIVANEVACGNDKTCIRTNRGQQQDLDFRLKQACKEGGPEYRLSAMQFSMIQREPASDGSGRMVKAFGAYNVPAVVTSDFGTDAKGNVLWAGPNRLSDDMIKLKNRNSAEYVVFFEIEATRCDDPSEVIYLDPRVENTGL